MNEQTRITGAKDGKPVPQDHDCEWCGKTATVAVELLTKTGAGKGQFIFACWNHNETARQMAKTRR